MKQIIWASWILIGVLQAQVSAQAAQFGIVYTHDEQAVRFPKLKPESVLGVRDAQPRPFTRTKLLYRGGPVLAKARVYAVMWGANVDAQTQAGIGPMLDSTLNSSYFDLLAEYDTTISASDGRAGTQQRIARGVFGGTVEIQPASRANLITDEQIGKEIERQIGLGVLQKPDADTVYMMYFPPGLTIDLQGARSCQVFCGYHFHYQSPLYGEVFYGVHPDLGGACSIGCGFAATRFDDLTSVTSHELAEVVTDPAVDASSNLPGYPDGWNTAKGEEIGDLCSSDVTKLTVASGKTYVLQRAFDNATGACAPGPYVSP